MIAAFRSREFLLFIVTGGIAALCNFGARILFNFWFDFSISVVLAYLVGMATAFLLARNFVFRQSAQRLEKSVLLFALVNVVAVAQTWLISVGLFRYFFPAIGLTAYSAEIAHAIGVMVPVFTSYLGHKYWTFRPDSAS